MPLLPVIGNKQRGDLCQPDQAYIFLDTMAHDYARAATRHPLAEDRRAALAQAARCADAAAERLAGGGHV